MSILELGGVCYLIWKGILTTAEIHRGWLFYKTTKQREIRKYG